MESMRTERPDDVHRQTGDKQSHDQDKAGTAWIGDEQFMRRSSGSTS